MSPIPGEPREHFVDRFVSTCKVAQADFPDVAARRAVAERVYDDEAPRKDFERRDFDESKHPRDAHGRFSEGAAYEKTPAGIVAKFHARRDEVLAAYADPASEAVKEAKELGVNIGTPEEMKAKLQAAADAVARGKVWARVPDAAFAGVLEDGRFKNQFESGTSRGLKDYEKRADFEDRYFGTKSSGDERTTDAERPIYGYLDSHPDGANAGSEFDGLRQYGGVAVQFKDEVRNRTTFTGDDSLDGNRAYVSAEASGNARFLPSPVNAPSSVSIPFEYGSGMMKAGSYTAGRPGKVLLGEESTAAERYGKLHGERYAEAQIHGGDLGLKDVQEVVFYNAKTHERYRAKLNKLGIPNRYAKSPYGDNYE